MRMRDADQRTHGHTAPLTALASAAGLAAGLSIGAAAHGQAGGPGVGGGPGGPPPPAPEFRTIDGTGNNIANPDWGKAHAELLRGPSGAWYEDGLGSMIDRGNERVVSNTLAEQTEAGEGNAHHVSAMFWNWGQFIDHDFALVESGGVEPILIFTPTDDEFFAPGAVIPTTRAAFATGDDGVRQYPNEITHFIDGSGVYGSDATRAAALRTFVGGKLLTEDGFLPRNTLGISNANESPLPDVAMFAAGDIRSNEQPGLTALHGLFVLEHNHWADRLADRHPGWDDERIYQTARAIVSATIQKITYEDWLPLLIGPDHTQGGLRGDATYNPVVNAGLMDRFSGAGFRFGHTMLNDRVMRFNADGTEFTAGDKTGGGHLELFQAFFNPGAFDEDGALEAIFRGMAWQEANEIDTEAIDSVRSFLFGLPTDGGLDLISLNVARGRDLGLPSFNQIRQDLGLAPVQSFEQITGTQTQRAADLSNAFADCYETVDDVDAWPGLVAEPHVGEGMVGRTLSRLLRDQFGRLRSGDRFFYRWDPAVRPYIVEIERTVLSDIIERNVGVALQHDAFLMPDVSPDPCSPVDLVAPWGSVDLLDAFAFLDGYPGARDAADLARPFGVVDVRDALEFLDLYADGCD